MISLTYMHTIHLPTYQRQLKKNIQILREIIYNIIWIWLYMWLVIGVLVVTNILQ